MSECDVHNFIDNLAIKLDTNNITKLEGQRSVYVINNNTALYIKISRKTQFWGISKKVKEKLKATPYRIFICLIDGDIERIFIIPLDEFDDYLESGNLAKDGSFKLVGLKDNYISIGGCPINFDGNEYLNNYKQVMQ